MRTDQIMTRSVVTCRPMDTLDKAVKLMLERSCGVLPVIGNDGHLAGIVTDRDICVAAHNEGLPLRGIKVKQAMSIKVVAARPNDSIEAVERLMAERRVRRVPVLDADGHVVGMISIDDIVREAARAHLQDATVVETIAAICEPAYELRPSPPAATVI